MGMFETINGLFDLKNGGWLQSACADWWWLRVWFIGQPIAACMPVIPSKISDAWPRLELKRTWAARTRRSPSPWEPTHSKDTPFKAGMLQIYTFNTTPILTKIVSIGQFGPINGTHKTKGAAFCDFQSVHSFLSQLRLIKMKSIKIDMGMKWLIYNSTKSFSHHGKRRAGIKR